MAEPFRKQSASAPVGYFAWEASGLRWLADAGGASVVEVRGFGHDHLDLGRLTPASPTAPAAEEFGRGLARMHVAGATGFGAPPTDWTGDGYLGPLSEPLPLMLRPTSDWAEFYAEQRIAPLTRLGRDRGVFSARDVAILDRRASRLAADDTGEVASRIHGDLWSGNLYWTPGGAVLIDPAAHGGHREADLAMLALFGAPHLSRILSSYDEASPLEAGWRDRFRIHQLHPLLVHAVLFGAGYAAQALAIASQ